MANFALLVGINRYKNPKDRLRGCINDVRNMKKALTNNGFQSKNITELLDGYATKQKIIRELELLMNSPGDEPNHLFFHYSGHGSQVPSVGFYEQDAMCEVICPYDYQNAWDEPLSDHVFKSIFSKKKSKDRLSVVLDCCHSGNGTRGNKTRGIPRFIEPPDKIIKRARVNRLCVKQANDLSEVSDSMNHILYAACRSEQTSADAFIGCRYQGAWTWALTNAISSTKNALAASVFQTATYAVIKKGFEQRPVLEGNFSGKGFF